ncbi:MAG: hypothetical protein ACRD5B_15970 [Nitrososphaeraceae archaeon]
MASPYMITTLQQIIDERISFLKEQINEENKPKGTKPSKFRLMQLGVLMILRKLNLSSRKRKFY